MSLTVLYPTKLEQEALAARIAAAGMAPTALTDACDAFAVGEWNAETLNAWITEQKTKRPHLWPAKGDADLESAAFVGRNLSARARLLQQLGEEAANTRAKAWGLRDLHDYRTRATRPGGDSGGNKEKPTRDNPWSAEGWSLTAQGRIYKSDPDLAGRLAKAAGSFIGATRPTKAA